MCNGREFLKEAAAFAGVSEDRLLARILHVEKSGISSITREMTPAIAELALHVDRELRLRNPALHYVVRDTYIGYRREGISSGFKGERSQVFASMVRSATRLHIVLPVDPAVAADLSYVQDLRGKGHHGIGDVRVSLRTVQDVERFLADFDYWLTPSHYKID